MENGLKRCESHWIFAAALGLGLLFAAPGQAQTFEEGYQSYMRNQFPVAELQFRAAAKKAKTKEDRAFIQKFIGICQFMRGDKKSAATSFQEALNSDRNITIDEEEVLDPGVVSFFQVIRNRWLTTPEGKAASVAAAPASKPAPVVPAPPPQAPKAAPPEAAPPPKAVAPESKPAAALVEKPKKKKPKDKDAARAEESGRMISWMHFMPFGLGQFHNESYILGGLFAVGQVAAIYQYASLDQQISEERAQNREVSDNPNILQAEKDKFLLENRGYIDGLTSDKNAAAGAFAALYVLGVAQSLIWAPRHPSSDESAGPETSKKPRKNMINTAWIPTPSGGTWMLGLRVNLE